jgi:hypothetical protein
VQLQGLASAVGTFLGTCVRIPCEVMKQRLQVGRHTSVLEAAMKATEVEGPRGLFRGTTATLAREVPFYVFGMVGYEQLKKVANGASLFSFTAYKRQRRVGKLGRGPTKAFGGPTALVAREDPFYVFGMVGYEHLTKVANGASSFLG